jgi:hypothetical protein
MPFSVRSALLCLAAVGAGCVPLRPETPGVQKKLQFVSAGFTGCMPEDNAITNIDPHPVGEFTWNATCNTSAYLCSSIDEVSGQTHYNCAPVAQ